MYIVLHRPAKKPEQLNFIFVLMTRIPKTSLKKKKRGHSDVMKTKFKKNYFGKIVNILGPEALRSYHWLYRVELS